MEGVSNKLIDLSKRSIVWLLLLIFCSLLLGEGLHTHKLYTNAPSSIVNSTNNAVVKHPQSFCKFCDYLLHHNHILTPGIYQVTILSVKIVFVPGYSSQKVDYISGDLLLFSGNSPPLV